MLAARWQQQGMPELADLAEPLIALAERLRPVVAESPNVSPNIYVMY